jgi:HAD superfamily phosphoserine phosphatase-like hydrolase
MIVVSDLEGTLTEGATWRGMGEYLKQNGKAAQYRLRFALWFPRFMAARLKLVDEQDMKNGWLLQILGMMAGATPGEFQAMADWVVEHEMWPKRRLDVLAEFDEHRKKGARIIVASGTYQAIAEGFAKRIGAEALGSDVELVNGVVTGRLTTEVSVRDTKARRAREVLGDTPIEFAYGDTTSDVPLLELAAQPVAVHPDDKFRQIASARGWRIIG